MPILGSLITAMERKFKLGELNAEGNIYLLTFIPYPYENRLTFTLTSLLFLLVMAYTLTGADDWQNEPMADLRHRQWDLSYGPNHLKRSFNCVGRSPVERSISRHWANDSTLIIWQEVGPSIYEKALIQSCMPMQKFFMTLNQRNLLPHSECNIGGSLAGLLKPMHYGFYLPRL